MNRESGGVPVSFVIPTLNQAGYLGRCLESCFSQRIEGAEILVQDGGSTDGTLEILHRYGDRVDWVSQPDDGQSDAINQAIGRARGELIAWINSDDYYAYEHVVSDVVRILESNRDIDLVYGDGMFVDPQGRSLRRYRASEFQDPRRAFISRGSSPCAQPAVFFKRELFERVGGLRDDLHWTMDQELWMRMFTAASTWRYVPKVLANLTLHEDAKSVRAIGAQIRESARVKQEFLRSHDGSWQEYAMVHWCVFKQQLYRLALGSGLIQVFWAALRRGRKPSEISASALKGDLAP